MRQLYFCGKLAFSIVNVIVLMICVTWTLSSAAPKTLRVLDNGKTSDTDRFISVTGSALFALHDGSLISINVRTAQKDWTYRPASYAAIEGGIVYITSPTSSGSLDLVALEQISGHVLWRRVSSGGLLIANTNGVIAGNEKQIARYNSAGHLIWRKSSVENLKAFFKFTDRYVVASGIESGSALHSVGSILDFSSGKTVANVSSGDLLNMSTDKIAFEVYAGNNNFDTWCGSANIMLLTLAKSGAPQTTFNKYVIENIPDNTQSTPCTNDRYAIPKAEFANNSLVLSSGALTAVFDIGKPDKPKMLLHDATFIGGPYGNIIALRNASAVKVYDLTRGKLTSILVSADAIVSTARILNTLYVSTGSTITLYDVATLNRVGRYQLACSAIIAVGSVDGQDVFTCFHDNKPGTFTVYSI